MSERRTKILRISQLFKGYRPMFQVSFIPPRQAVLEA